jgi:hypothetical protein
MKKRDCGTDLSSIIHQTWKLVDMAEIELHVLMGQCLNRRIEDKSIYKGRNRNVAGSAKMPI